jgi:hypothetical protein
MSLEVVLSFSCIQLVIECSTGYAKLSLLVDRAIDLNTEHSMKAIIWMIPSVMMSDFRMCITVTWRSRCLRVRRITRGK